MPTNPKNFCKNLCLISILMLTTVVHSQNYDVTPFYQNHVDLGYKIPRMIGIYEADLFVDKQDLIQHQANGDMPDSQIWKDKIRNNLGLPVMLDFESTTDDDYLHDVTNFIKSYDIGNREWWIYGCPYSPRHQMDWSINNAVTQALIAKDSRSMALVDGYMVPCYLRWDFKDIERFKFKKFLCDIAEKRSIALVWSAHHELHVDVPKRNTPIPTNDLINLVNEMKSAYGQVGLWAQPSSYQPDEFEERLNINDLIVLGLLK